MNILGPLIDLVLEILDIWLHKKAKPNNKTSGQKKQAEVLVVPCQLDTEYLLAVSKDEIATAVTTTKSFCIQLNKILVIDQDGQLFVSLVTRDLLDHLNALEFQEFETNPLFSNWLKIVKRSHPIEWPPWLTSEDSQDHKKWQGILANFNIANALTNYTKVVYEFHRKIKQNRGNIARQKMRILSA